MDFNCQIEIYRRLREEINNSQSESLTGLLEEIERAACRYAGLRSEWVFLHRKRSTADQIERFAEIDGKRTMAHDTFIDTCNILSRNMRKMDLDIEWRKNLGDHRTKTGRKIIGDFACVIQFDLAWKS